MRNDHGSIVLQRTFSEPQFPVSNSNQEKKSPAFNSSLTQYKHSNSSNISGRRVKPYISKREREKLAHTALPSSSPLKRQLALEKSNFDHTINEVDLQPNRPCEISDGKHLARACRPPKQLHLNFEGRRRESTVCIGTQLEVTCYYLQQWITWSVYGTLHVGVHAAGDLHIIQQQ